MADSIQDFFVETEKQKAHEGTQFNVYPFADDSFRKYLLRVHRFLELTELEWLVERSLVTTNMTPIDFHFRRNLGQPLLRGISDYVEVIRKEEGESLRYLWERECDELINKGTEEDLARQKASRYQLKNLLNLPDEQIAKLMEDINSLRREIRTESDVHANNILLGKNGLSLIDVDNGEDRGGANLAKLKQAILFHPNRNNDAEIEDLKNQMTVKLHKAAELTHFPLTREEAQKRIRTSGIVYRPPSYIEAITPISLFQTPKELLLKLAEIEEYLGVDKWQR